MYHRVPFAPCRKLAFKSQSGDITTIGASADSNSPLQISNFEEEMSSHSRPQKNSLYVTSSAALRFPTNRIQDRVDHIVL